MRLCTACRMRCSDEHGSICCLDTATHIHMVSGIQTSGESSTRAVFRGSYNNIVRILRFLPGGV
jgi:hypothetical protein